MSTRVPAEIIYSLLDTKWQNANTPKPVLKQREMAEELREEIPEGRGLILIYAESGGVRESPRGNRLYKDETVNVTVECHSIKSHSQLYDIMEEVTRIMEENTRNIAPFQVCRTISYAESYGRQYREWKGELKLEMDRVAVRTAYRGPGGDVPTS